MLNICDVDMYCDTLINHYLLLTYLLTFVLNNFEVPEKAKAAKDRIFKSKYNYC